MEFNACKAIEIAIVNSSCSLYFLSMLSEGILPDLLRTRVFPDIRRITPGKTAWGQADHPLLSAAMYPMPPYVREFYPHNRIIKFCYVVSGSCALVISNRCFVLPEGALGIVRRNRFNYEACLQPAVPYMLIWCSLHTVNEFSIRLCRYQANNYELNIESFVMPVSASHAAGFEKALEPAVQWELIHTELTALIDAAEALLENQADSGIRHTVRDDGRIGRRQKHVVQDCIRYIRQNYRKKILLGDAARAAGLHPNYLDTLIRQVTGSSFKRHLSHFRLKEAHRLLNKPHRSIAEIAYRCGFNDPYNFSHFFKKYTGISPKMFRDRYFGAL